MSVYDYILRDSPAGTFKFSTGVTTISDFGGTGSTLVLNSAVTPGTPLVSGSPRSALLDGTDTFYIAPSRFVQGQEGLPFTLEIWVKFNTFSAPASILSHSTMFDGLMTDGDNIKFVVAFSDSSTVTASWPIPDFSKVYHVVGIYTRTTIYLYVDGELVDQEDISDAQQALLFKSTPNSRLYAGLSSLDNQRMLVDAPTYYNHILQNASIKRHYDAARQFIDYRDNAAKYDGITWGLTDADRASDLSLVWQEEADWLLGSGTRVSYGDDTLRPDLDAVTSVSYAGTWIGSVPVMATGDTSLGGVKLEWDADGLFAVSVSLDGGTTYNAVSNGQIVNGTQAWDTTSKVLLVKITFTGGVVNDPAVVRDLRAVTYRDNTVSGSQTGRTITAAGNVATATLDTQPIEQYDAQGARTRGTNSLTITADGSGDVTYIRSLEGWFYFTDVSTLQVPFDNRAAGGTSYLSKAAAGAVTFPAGHTLYVNGSSVSSGAFTPSVGVWYHLVLVCAADFDYATVVNNVVGQVGKLATYPSALTAAQVADLYNGYFSLPIATVDDTNPITVTEDSPAYTIYAYDWSLSGATT